ncbi:MAG: translocation/assembly module TamB domain-containing protein [Pseudomonadota bacterium]
MRWVRLPLLAVLALWALAPPAQTQDRPGLIGRQIENALSGPGRVASVSGFRGALSGRATMSELTLADDDGVWLTLRGAVLDWNRSALLRGRLSVNELSAEELIVVRPPLPAPTDTARPEAPPAEASGFALPELPVSINLGSIAIGEVLLGSAFLGEEATFDVSGSVVLESGAGDVDLAIARTGGIEDQIALDASFDNATRVLALDLTVEEGAGGIASNLLNIPGAPSLALDVDGEGPLDDYTAVIDLRTDGAQRVAGEVRLRGVEGGGDLRFSADVGGDVTPIIAPQYRDFFGPDVRLDVDGLRAQDGALDLERLEIQARSLDLSGSAELGADGIPRRFNLTGQLADPTGQPVRLPVGQGEQDAVRLAGADLALTYDAATGDDWTLDVSARDVDSPEVTLDALALSGGGTLRQAGSDGPVAVTAELDYAASGLVPADQAVAEALGEEVGGRAEIRWTQGQPVFIDDLTLGGADYGLDIAGNALFANRSLRLDGSATLAAADLSRFSAISGQQLTGRADVELAAQGDILAGIFSATVDVVGEGLGIGQEVADRFLEDPVTISTALRRDETGTYLDFFNLDSAGVTASAEGQIGSGAGDIGGTLSLTDASLLRPDLEGALTVQGRGAENEPGLWNVDVDLTGPYGLEGDVAGAVGLGQSDVVLDLALPDIAPFLPDYTGPVTVRGTAAEARAGLWDVDLDIGTPYDGRLDLAGLVGGGESDLTLNLSLPNIEPLVPQFTGAITVRGTAAEAEAGLWDVDLDAETPYDGSLAIEGRVGGGQGDVTLDIALPDIQPLVPQITGAISVRGTAEEQAGGVWDVDLSANTPYDGTLAIQGLAGGGQSDLALDLALPDIQPLVPQFSGAIVVRGTAAEAAGGQWDVDLGAGGPYSTTLAVEGVVGGGAGDVRLRASVPDVAAFAPGVPGAASLTGRARETGQNGLWQVALDSTLPYAATANVEGRVGASGSAVSYALRLPDVGALSPGLTGALAATGTASQTVENRWQVTSDIDGPYDATANATALLGPGIDGSGRTEADVRLSVPSLAPLIPTLRGGLSATASTVQQEGGAWDVDLDASGPFNSTATAAGTVGGGDTNADIALTLPDISPFAPQYAGALRVNATARQPAGAPIAVDGNIAAPYGISADVSGQLGQGEGQIRLGASVPNIAPFAQGLTGAVRLEGTGTEGPSGWAVDLTANGPDAASTRVSGTLAPDFATADLGIAGTAPLGLLNGVLAPVRLIGDVGFDLRMQGAPGLPALSGTVSTQDTSLEIPTVDQRFDQINLSVTLANSTATLDGTARSAAGGGVTISGPIQLTGLTADLAVGLNNLVLEDPSLFRIEVGGSATVTGPLSGGGGAIGGRINIGRTELRIPSGGLGFGGAIPLITHVAEPGAVRLTRERAGLINTAREARGGERGPNIFALDLDIRAPRQIFLRGRGLDAELGGEFRIGGTTRAPAPVGGINVIRGRLDLLGKRLDLEDSGRVTLGGDLKPFLDLLATSETEEFTIRIEISGPVDQPEFTFSSSPDLPQDEVLAQFFFGKGLANLSPVQAVQLAASIRTLTGRGGPGISGALRQGLGVDDFNIVTDDQGDAALQVGQYLTDNIYTDVTTSSTGSEVSLNIDITDDVTVEASTDDKGESSIGIFYQRDY